MPVSFPANILCSARVATRTSSDSRPHLLIAQSNIPNYIIDMSILKYSYLQKNRSSSAHHAYYISSKKLYIGPYDVVSISGSLGEWRMLVDGVTVRSITVSRYGRCTFMRPLVLQSNHPTGESIWWWAFSCITIHPSHTTSISTAQHFSVALIQLANVGVESNE